MSFKHPQHSYYSKDRTLKNVKDLERLKSISPEKCGRELCLSHVPYNLLNKLKSVILHSQIEKIILISCFDDPFHTLQILESMQRNDCLFSVHLNLLDNVHNNQCVAAIIDLITRGVVNSIEVPRELNEENSERLLAGILNSQRELKIVNLNGCTLNTTALGHLQELLAKGRISKELNFANCLGLCKSKLTTMDKSEIQKALNFGKKQTRQSPKVKWFDVVEHIEDVGVYRGRIKVSFKKVVRVVYNRATKRKEERVIQLVRLGLDAWQQYKPGSKRSNQSDNANIAEKRSGIDDEMERISEQLASQKVSDKKDSSKWKRFKTGAWRKRKKAPDFSNALMKDSDKVKEDNRSIQQPYNERQRYCTKQRNDDMTRHSEQTFEKSSQQIYAEVYKAPEDSAMDECFDELSTPQDSKASPPGIQYGALRERQLPDSTRVGPRASSDFGSRYQFPYADEQPDHQAHADLPVQPTSRSASMSPQFVNPDGERNQRRSHRSLSCSIEPQRNERLVNPRQGAPSSGRGGRRNQVSGNNTISQQSAAGAAFQNHQQGRSNNNNNIMRPMTRAYSREIASRGRGGQRGGNNSMRRQSAGASASQVLEQANALRQGINGSSVIFINPTFNDYKTVSGTNVAMDNSQFNIRDQNRPNVINNGSLPQQAPAEDQMEHDADDQGEPQIHDQPGENIRHPEDDDASDEDNFEDAHENL
uniref:uncharacterized protein LOC120341133 n=1 Tax=Styela clava TaxID=7725 RepID=UPI00193A2FC4|nr:uncharacterized protein LOC120341133 [Styela clava]